MKNTLILITTTASLAFPALLSAQEHADPFSKKITAAVGAPAEKQAELPRNISICYEAFSLSLPEAAALMRSTPTDSQLYKTILTLVQEKKAKQEALSIVRSQTGQKATTESVVETMYPTEWDPAELPNVVGVQIVPEKSNDNPQPPPAPATENLTNAPHINDISALKTPANPTAYDTRNTGLTIEVEPQINVDGSVDLRISPEHVTMIGRADWGQGAATQQAPEFKTQRLTTSTSLRPNSPRLLGTISEPPASEQAKDHVSTVWFAFITVNLIN